MSILNVYQIEHLIRIQDRFNQCQYLIAITNVICQLMLTFHSQCELVLRYMSSIATNSLTCDTVRIT